MSGNLDGHWVNGTLERQDCIAQMAWLEMLIADRHARVAVPEHLHHGALRDTGHRQRAGDVVSQVVKRHVLKPHALDQAGERPRDAGLPMRSPPSTRP